MIQHIWITVDSKTSEGDCFVLRDLIMRMYWDGEENPSVEVPLGDLDVYKRQECTQAWC